MKSWRRRTGNPRPNVRAHQPRRLSRLTVGRGGLARIKRGWWVLAGIAMVGLAGWGAIEAYRVAKPVVNEWLEVREVAVNGTNQVTRQEVVDRLALPSGATLLSVKPSEMVTRLLTHPWIKAASVRRVPLHTLAVTIAERLPAAVLKTASRSLLLDGDGYVLAVIPEGGEPQLPLLMGIDHRGLLDGQEQPRRAAQAGIKLAGLLSDEFEGRAEVDMANPDNAVVYIQGLRFQFGASPFDAQWERYRKIEQALSVHANDGPGGPRNEIDLRYPDKVIVRERG